MVVLGSKSLKEFVGEVVSSSMDKTIVVSISVVKMHPLYKKRYTEYKKCYVHDEDNTAKVWDLVKIRQWSPKSKLKRWVLVEIVQSIVQA